MEEVKRDQVVYLQAGKLYKTCSEEAGELKVILISATEVTALYETAAELHSLKMSINESYLKQRFPEKVMSFHDKVIFAIHDCLEIEKTLRKRCEDLEAENKRLSEFDER